MVQESISRKRNLLYEMLLKLSGIEKRILLSEEEIKKEISKINDLYGPFLISMPKFLEILMKYLHNHLKDKIDLSKIEKKEILESAYQNIQELGVLGARLEELRTSLMSLLDNQIKLFKGLKPKKEETSLDVDQILQFLLIAFNRIDKKLTKLLPPISAEQETEFNAINDEGTSVLKLLKSSALADSNIEDLISQIKKLNQKLNYKKASFSFALILRGYKQERVSLQKFLAILKTNVRAEVIRALIILALETFGPLSIEQLETKTKINSKDIFTNCIALLDLKELVITSAENQIYYDLVREYPKLYRFISEETMNLKKNMNKLPILSRSLLTAILSISKEILNKILNIGFSADNIYKEEINNLSDSFNKLKRALSPKELDRRKMIQRDRIEALIELYNMFRVKMVHEKQPYLLEPDIQENRRIKLENFLLTVMKLDFERGLLISILKNKGPLKVRDLASESGLPTNKVVRHILKLGKDKKVITKGTDNDYFLYDVPRTPSLSEKAFQNIIIPSINLIKAYINIAEYKEFELEKISRITIDLYKISENLSKLLELSLDLPIEDKLQTELEQTNLILIRCRQLEEKLPKTRSKFDLTKLAVMSLPRIEEEYAALIEPQYLVGFGDIEWDINKCLACASCQEICPESAINLLREWDLPATFEMSEEVLENLPENRRKLIHLIKKLAVKKPEKSIRLPKDTLGFGKIKYDPLMCIACRKCEECCPNSALTFQEYWNFPEIMKSLLEEG